MSYSADEVNKYRRSAMFIVHRMTRDFSQQCTIIAVISAIGFGLLSGFILPKGSVSNYYAWACTLIFVGQALAFGYMWFRSSKSMKELTL